MRKEIVGEKEEIQVLERLYPSQKAEFLAVYGRRRIGKTFLINQFFKNAEIYFGLTGNKDASKNEQLIHFHREFMALFKSERKSLPSN